MVNTNIVEGMDIDKIVRWSCLIESIQVADAQMKRLGIDPERYDWVRPIAITSYIDERFASMKHDILHEMKYGVHEETQEEKFFK